jgi:hypothetical protein
MRRMFLAAVALVLALPGGAAAAPRDSAVGTGENQIGRVSFAAHALPGVPTSASGHFTAKGQLAELPGVTEVGPFHFEGPVTCLQVAGNRAGLIYPLKNADPENFEGSWIYISLEDNGNPASGDPADKIGFAGPVPGPPPSVCLPTAATADITHGNFTIREAP